ncbi:MAG: ABC transporter permease [Planctomycetes bacterium]|nr:ABC transporter permease [Planctomycetota bacterium]
MKVFLAILLDSLYETLDKKILYVVVGLSLLFIVLGASIGFEPTPFPDIVKKRWGNLTHMWSQSGMGVGFVSSPEPVMEIVSVRERKDGSYEVEARMKHPDYARRMTKLLERERRMLAGEKVDFDDEDDQHIGGYGPPEKPEPAEPEKPLAAEEARAFFRELAEHDLFGLQSYMDRGDSTYEIVLRPPHPHEIVGGGDVTLFFGAVDISLERQSYASTILEFQSNMASWAAGWAGILIAIVITAGFFPNMLQEGSIDLLVSKPIHRLVLFFAKYAGGLLFVLLNAIVLIGGLWLATSVRSGFYNFGFLATIGSVLLVFAIIYSVSVFWAVMTRSTVMAILMSVVFWVVCWVIGLVLNMILMFERMGAGVPSWLVGTVKVLYYVFPSTSNFDKLNIWLVSLAPISDAAREHFLKTSQFEMSTYGVSLPWSLVTSLAFAAAVLGFTAWRFHKRDF